MTDIIIILIVVSCIVAWVLWTERKSKQALDKDVVDLAWHEVLDEAYDMERRQFEERKRIEDDEHKRVAAARH